MKHFSHINSGTCSRAVEFDIDSEGRLHNVCFVGGCPGNTIGITSLAEGMDARTLADRLEGTPCGNRGTSCPDQLAKAIAEALGE